MTTSGPIITSVPIVNGPCTAQFMPMPDLSPILIPAPVPNLAPFSTFTSLPHLSKHLAEKNLQILRHHIKYLFVDAGRNCANP